MLTKKRTIRHRPFNSAIQIHDHIVLATVSLLFPAFEAREKIGIRVGTMEGVIDLDRADKLMWLISASATAPAPSSRV